MRADNPKAADYVAGIAPSSYCIAFMPQGVSLYGHRTSNRIESKNSVIVNLRGEEPLQFVDRFLSSEMAKLNQLRDEASKWGASQAWWCCALHDNATHNTRNMQHATHTHACWQVLTPWASAIYSRNDELSQRCQVERSTEDIWYCTYAGSMERNRRKVVLSAKTCSCLGWQQDKIPCQHAISAAREAGMLDNMAAWYEQSVERCFHSVHYKAALAQAHIEIPIMDTLIRDGKTKPAKWVPRPGRPRKRRYRSKGEPSGKAANPRKCHRCGQLATANHNSRTCTGADNASSLL